MVYKNCSFEFPQLKCLNSYDSPLKRDKLLYYMKARVMCYIDDNPFLDNLVQKSS